MGAAKKDQEAPVPCRGHPGRGAPKSEEGEFVVQVSATSSEGAPLSYRDAINHQEDA